MELMISDNGRNYYRGGNLCETETLQAEEQYTKWKVPSLLQLNSVVSWVCSYFMCLYVCVSLGSCVDKLCEDMFGSLYTFTGLFKV